jgi:hypothetical protein
MAVSFPVLFSVFFSRDDTFDAQNPAHLVTQTIGPLFVGFIISAAYLWILSGAGIGFPECPCIGSSE